MHPTTPQKDWDDIWDKNTKFEIAPKDNIIRKWLEKYFGALNINDDKSVLEIGCFPGSYLAVFGDLGYKLNGIDLYPKVSTDLPLWLKNNNYKIGDFYQSDFLTYKNEKKFDVVCSFGFIEHFANFEEVIIKHARLVKDGGYLVITTPNYRGLIQKILHITLNTAVYRAYLKAPMNPDLWKNIVKKFGFDALFCGGLGNFSFWAENEKQNILQKLLSRLVMHSLVYSNL